MGCAGTRYVAEEGGLYGGHPLTGDEFQYRQSRNHHDAAHPCSAWQRQLGSDPIWYPHGSTAPEETA